MLAGFPSIFSFTPHTVPSILCLPQKMLMAYPEILLVLCAFLAGLIVAWIWYRSKVCVIEGRAQNVAASIALISILIPLAVFGILGLAAVVLVHEIAEVFVIANGVRAGRTTHLPTLTAPATRPALQGAAV